MIHLIIPDFKTTTQTHIRHNSIDKTQPTIDNAGDQIEQPCVQENFCHLKKTATDSNEDIAAHGVPSPCATIP